MNILGSNWKTYAAVGGLIVVSILEGTGLVDIPGVTLDQNWLTVLLGSIGLGGLRSAIGKV